MPTKVEIEAAIARVESKTEQVAEEEAMINGTGKSSFELQDYYIQRGFRGPKAADMRAGYVESFCEVFGHNLVENCTTERFVEKAVKFRTEMTEKAPMAFGNRVTLRQIREVAKELGLVHQYDAAVSKVNQSSREAVLA